MNEWPADCGAYEFTMTNRPLIKVDDCSGNFQSAWRRLFVSRVIIHRPCADEIAVCIVGDPWRHGACDVGVSASVLSTIPFRDSTSHNLNRESSGQTLSWCTVTHKSICKFVETFRIYYMYYMKHLKISLELQWSWLNCNCIGKVWNKSENLHRS